MERASLRRLHLDKLGDLPCLQGDHVRITERTRSASGPPTVLLQETSDLPLSLDAAAHDGGTVRASYASSVNCNARNAIAYSRHASESPAWNPACNCWHRHRT